MSKSDPREVRRLCRRLQPLLREKEARKEFIEQCRIHHRQQMHRSFPRKGRPSPSVRLTAYVALTALRWLEEKSSGEFCAFVPSWDDLKMMGKCLIRSKGYVAILADKVGGGIGRDQIYSYFSMGRKRPDGEFVLRLVKFIELLRAISVHPSLGPHFRTLRAWRNIETAFIIQEQRRYESASVAATHPDQNKISPSPTWSDAY